MTSPRRRARSPLACVLLAGGLLLGGACSSGPDDSERAVCDSLQGMIDDLEAGDGSAALAQLVEVRTAVDGTENEELRRAGDEFFAAITGEVPDIGALTVDESVELGNEVLVDAEAGFIGMAAECERIGILLQADPAKLQPEG